MSMLSHRPNSISRTTHLPVADMLTPHFAINVTSFDFAYFKYATARSACQLILFRPMYRLRVNTVLLKLKPRSL